MMAQATNWYNSPTPAPLGMSDMLAIKDAAQARKLKDIFAANMDARGNLNQSGFYKDAAAAGMGKDEMEAAMQYRAAQNQADVGQQQSNQMLRLYGADPTAAGRNSAQIGEPGIGSAPNPSAGQPTASSQTDTPAAAAPAEPSNRLVTAAPPPAPASAPQQAAPSSFVDYFQQLKASAQAARAQTGLPQQAEPTDPALQPSLNSEALAKLFGMQPRPAANGNLQATAPAPEQGSQDIQGQVEINPGQQAAPPSPTMQLPPPVVAQSPTVPVQLPDTRDARQAVEDSYNPANSMMGRMTAAASVGPLAYTKDTPAPILQSGATTLARLHYDNDGTLPSVNRALQQYVQDKSDAIGPPPMIPPMKDGVPDMAAFLNQQREWQGKVQGISLAVHNDLGESYGKQFDQALAASSNDMGVKKMVNEVTEKNAELGGASKLAAGIDSVVTKGDPILGNAHLNPMTFTSTKDLDAFGDRATAYAKLGENVPTDVPGLLAWSKNFGQAEGLPGTEGTQSLLMMIGAPNSAARLQTALASGAKMDGATVASILFQGLLEGNPDMSQLKGQMKFTKDYLRHSGANSTPTMQAGGQSVQPYMQVAPKTLGQMVGTKLPTVTDASGYDALPPGSRYQDTNGKTYTKKAR
jgi:hypothetical protein